VCDRAEIDDGFSGGLTGYSTSSDVGDILCSCFWPLSVTRKLLIIRVGCLTADVVDVVQRKLYLQGCSSALGSLAYRGLRIPSL
jgi:hypothetical protein